MPKPRSASRRAALALLALAVLGGCADDDDPETSVTTVPPTDEPAETMPPATSSTTTPSSTEDTAPADGDGCTTGDVTVPEGAASTEVVDVDGDGAPDEAWIATGEGGEVTVGINTAAGGGATVPFDSASPVRRSVLVVDADETAPVELFLDDGRSVQLHAFVDCEIVPVTNPEGETYTFSLGFTEVGTGVGCVETPAGRRLVGLDVVERDDEGGTVEWSRTVVELDGTTATNGATEAGTFQSPEDDVAIELLTRVSCGELTMIDDGLTLPR